MNTQKKLSVQLLCFAIMTPFLGEFLSLPSWWTTIAGALCVVHEVLSLVIPTQYAKFVEWTNPQKQWKTRLKRRKRRYNAGSRFR